MVKLPLDHTSTEIVGAGSQISSTINQDIGKPAPTGKYKHGELHEVITINNSAI
ncbi:hypothetical protein B6N60_03659 [Richelia sinica FACHB-800]|uniref:Uncharacterized protein n=1 Tax=Richelia sinica FACHB-800 TaxID=1357546 RepID=A0A975TA72_9NOST|nr:hypothetical protein B6N60_03659 [Richelia sinica FACHB-800]